MKLTSAMILAALTLCTAAGCTTYATRPHNPSGSPTLYEDPRSVSESAGMGVESQDIIGMTDQVMRDMLADPVLAGRATPPRVIIDSKYFKNSSSERMNKRLITNRLRVALNRAARGRMVFVGRHATQMVEEERTYKREGIVDPGALPNARAPMGADYRLQGEFATLDRHGAYAGQSTRYTQAVFEMVDLETAELVWSGVYEYRKASQAHLIYR
jgi:hypothetical protein